MREAIVCLFFWSSNEWVTPLTGEGLAEAVTVRNADLQEIWSLSEYPLLHLQTIQVRWRPLGW